MSEYKIPCGWSSSSGDFCFKERLCLACCEVEKLNATIECQAQEIAALKAASSVVEDEMAAFCKHYNLPEGTTDFGDADYYGNEWNGWESRAALQPVSESEQPAAMPEDDAEQLARCKWTVKQWYEHVGAWENAQGEVCFGSVMALGAMLKLMAKARNSADPVASQDAIDALIERHRILLVPEYEGGFHAMVYQDSEIPISNFHASTVRAAVESAIDSARVKDQS